MTNSNKDKKHLDMQTWLEGMSQCECFGWLSYKKFNTALPFNLVYTPTEISNKNRNVCPNRGGTDLFLSYSD